eukprot:jgi/Mesvir1/15184/Mv06423-RA.3
MPIAFSFALCRGPPIFFPPPLQFFLYNLASTWVYGQERSLVRPVLSAATTAGDSTQWVYLSVGVAMGVGFHELGHALAAASEGVPMVHCSLFVAVVLLGAYVTLDPETLRELPPYRALRIFCAGVWHNAVAWLVCLLLLLTLPALLATGFRCGRGLLVMGAPPRSPLAPRLPPGAVITAVGDCPVHALSDWHACFENLRAAQTPHCGSPPAQSADRRNADGGIPAHEQDAGASVWSSGSLKNSLPSMDDGSILGGELGPGLLVKRVLLDDPIASFPALDVPAGRAGSDGGQHTMPLDRRVLLSARLAASQAGIGMDGGAVGEAGDSGTYGHARGNVSLSAGASPGVDKDAAKCLAQGKLPFLFKGGDASHLYCLLGADVATAPSCHPAQWGSYGGHAGAAAEMAGGHGGGSGAQRSEGEGIHMQGSRWRPGPGPTCASIREAQLAGHELACVTPMLPPCMVLARILVALPDGAVAARLAREEEHRRGGEEDTGRDGPFLLPRAVVDSLAHDSHPTGDDADPAPDYSACVAAQVFAGTRHGRAAQRRMRGFQPAWEVIAGPAHVLSQSLYLSDYIPRKVWYWMFGIGSVAVPTPDGRSGIGPLFPRLADAVVWFPYRLERLLGVLLQVSLSLALVNCVPAFFLDGQPMFSALLTSFTPRWSVVQRNAIIFPVLLLGTLLVVVSVAMAWAGPLWSILL